MRSPASIPAPTIMSQSRSASRCCWRACAPSCASARRATTRRSRIGDLHVPSALEAAVAAKGTKLRLTEKETAILRYLYRAAPSVVRRDVLLREVWGYNANVTTHTLETHIYRLRQKIEPDTEGARACW